MKSPNYEQDVSIHPVLIVACVSLSAIAFAIETVIISLFNSLKSDLSSFGVDLFAVMATFAGILAIIYSYCALWKLACFVSKNSLCGVREILSILFDPFLKFSRKTRVQFTSYHLMALALLILLVLELFITISWVLHHSDLLELFMSEL
jgi:hypothetical protein